MRFSKSCESLEVGSRPGRAVAWGHDMKAGRGKDASKPHADTLPAVRKRGRSTLMDYRQAFAQPMLSAADEVALVEAWRVNKDFAARDRIIDAHMRLCYAVAARYDNHPDHLRDLAQEGAFGLMTALDKFDPQKGTRFATYARWWVQNSVSDAVAGYALMVDMPSRTYLAARGGGHDNDELSWTARLAARGELALDAPVGEDGETTLGDSLPCPGPSPEATVSDDDRHAKIKRAVADALERGMSPREAEVLRRRPLAEKQETLEAIANDFGVSRERIRQIEVQSLDKLRRYLTNSGAVKALLR